MTSFPKRGEVWWVNLDPTIGSEINKKRTAIIVSNNSANRALARVQVVPTTSNIATVYPSEALVSFAVSHSKALADQLRTVAKERLGSKAGELSAGDMQKVELAIRIQLGL